MDISSGDTGSGDYGVNLDAHATGNPTRKLSGGITVGHTMLIILVALGLLWLFGGKLLRTVRM